MSIKGNLYGVKFGPEISFPGIANLNSGLNEFAMAPLNTGYCARFIATQNKDIKSIKLGWGTCTSPGVVSIRVETIDATNGKPTGTLYDVNAVLTGQTPVLGINTYTFASIPTTKLTVGSAYAIVVLTTTGGTTQNFRAGVSGSVNSTYPITYLTAADGTTRTNFAEVAGSTPSASLILDDNSEDSMGMGPFLGALLGTNLLTTGGTATAVALKFTTPVTLVVAGVEFGMQKAGTPIGDVNVSIMDSNNAVLTNSSVIIDKDFLLTGASGRQSMALFPGLVNVPKGTYRLVISSPGNTSTGNCWVLSSLAPISAASAPASFNRSTCPDVTNPVWTDTTNQPAIRLILDDIVPPLAANPLAGYVR